MARRRAGPAVVAAPGRRPLSGAQTAAMCRPLSPSQLTTLHTGRRVSRKYRRMSLRREFRRLRRILPRPPAGCPALSQAAVLEQTVNLIEQLEGRLLVQLQQAGVPAKLGGPLPANKELSVDTVRQLVGSLMAKTR